jgi:predicted nucleic acid-binding protein
MSYLLDANILFRSADVASEHHLMVTDAIANLFAQGISVLICMQSITEFWAVATRPVEANGLGFTTSLAREHAETFLALYGFVPDVTNTMSIWLDLVTKHQVRCKPTHDVKLVALMMAHDLKRILTVNTSDFKRFAEIKAAHPLEILENL